jgi:hypothetical protein
MEMLAYIAALFVAFFFSLATNASNGHEFTAPSLRISDQSGSREINGGLVEVWASDSHHILPLLVFSL